MRIDMDKEEIRNQEGEIPEGQEETSEEVSGEEEPAPEEPEPEEESVPAGEPDANEGLDWPEYVAQWKEDGLTEEEMKSPEDLISARLKLGRELESAKTAAQKLDILDRQLKAAGHPGVESLLGGGMPPQPQPAYQTTTPPPYYQPQPNLPTFVTEVDAAVKRGEMDADTAEHFKAYARVQDNILTQVYGVLGELVRQTSGVTKQVESVKTVRRDVEWNAFKDKDRFDRKVLDGFRDVHNFDDYHSAAMALTAMNPATFAAMVDKVEKRGEEKARKRLRNINYQRAKGSAGGGSAQVGWKDYQRGDGLPNEKKLDDHVRRGILKEKDRDWICDQIIKDIEERGL